MSAEFIIWDNGSVGQPFKDLLRKWKPDVLVESYNQGGGSGTKNLLSIARGKYVAYTDDDVFFYPGWLDKQLEIMLTYPNVGIVGGSPMRSLLRYTNLEVALKWARENAILEGGQLMPDAWDRDAYMSLVEKGTEQDYKRFRLCFPNDDHLITYKGVKAWAHGHHMQFLCDKEKVLPLRQASINGLDTAHYLDDAMDKAGFLRLTTYDRVCRHMGNVLDDDIRAEARRLKYL
jgi:glycosyltransferase involved in cell wall biosynthesis